MRPTSAPSDAGEYYGAFMARAEEECPLRAESARVGVREPRVYTPPLRDLTPETSLGFSVVEFARDVVGVDLLPWEQALLVRALELREDGRFRFRTVLLLVARQNGKSTVVQVLTLWAMYVLGVRLVIGTAQDLDIAETLWGEVVDIVESVPELDELKRNVVRVNGKKSLCLAGGEEYKVRVANRRGGRGLSGDLIVLDELREHTSWDAWGAITKTMMARPQAQAWCMSNAGDDSSVVLSSLRRKAHLALGDPDGVCADATEQAEGDDSLGVFEWSAAPGRGVWDRDGWAEANPSLGYVIAEESLASAAATDPEAVFRTECLCQWVTGLVSGPFGDGAWEACADPVGEIPQDAPLSFGVDVNWDRGSAYIGVCGVREDGRPQVEVAAGRPGGDWIDWVPRWFAEFVDADHPARVVVQAKGCPAASLVQPLSEVEGVEVVLWQGSDLAIGCGLMFDRVAAALGDAGSLPPLAHRGQEVLDLPARTAQQRVFGDGWYWDRRGSPHNASPLVAVTEALWDQVANERPQPSIFEAGAVSIF